MKQGLIACLFVVFAALPVPSVRAGSASAETLVSAEVTGELQYLLGFVGYGRKAPAEFEPERIGDLIGFLDGKKDSHRLYHAGRTSKGVASAYYEVDISQGLDHVLRLTYGANIPEVFTAPSTLRVAEWTHIDTPDRKLPRLWQAYGGRRSPVVLTGIEHLVNTPDQTTGAYYEYDLYRTIILTAVEGRRLLLSLSKQTGVSKVGKRGFIVGPDERWDYLYTGETGLNRFGIGWAKTYMYDSCSVAAYLEPANAPKAKLRFGVFKWLSAGWASMNVVRAAHIHAGLERYALTYKRILEEPRLADPGVPERTLAAIRGLAEGRMRELAGKYVSHLRNQVRAHKLLSEAGAKDLFAPGGYLEGMNRQELESILIGEYLKQVLGKPYRVDMLQSLAQR